jgi:hypothetical protein
MMHMFWFDEFRMVIEILGLGWCSFGSVMEDFYFGLQ